MSIIVHKALVFASITVPIIGGFSLGVAAPTEIAVSVGITLLVIATAAIISVEKFGEVGGVVAIAIGTASTAAAIGAFSVAVGVPIVGSFLVGGCTGVLIALANQEIRADYARKSE